MAASGQKHNEGLGNQQGNQIAMPKPVRGYRIYHGGDTTHPQFPHGEHAGHRAGCRCEPCLMAGRAYHAQKRRELRATNGPYAERQRQAKAEFRKTEAGRALYRSTNQARKQRTKNGRTNHSLMRRIYAACPSGYVVDHIVPLSRGGRHVPDNVQYLPIDINLQKAARLEFETATALDWRSILFETFNDYALEAVESSDSKRTASADDERVH